MARQPSPGDIATDGGEGRPISETIRDHVRAAVGGLLVGLPLLWTMEMWEHGSTLPPLKLLSLFALALVIVVGFNALSGFRRERTWVELLIDAVQGLGLSIAVAAAMLYILGRLEPELGLQTLIGRVTLLTIPVAFGTALAATVLSEQEEGSDEDPVGPIGRLLVAAGGALYFALNVAPTDEVRVLGSEADTPLLLAAILASLGISLAISFLVDTPGGSTGLRSGHGPLSHPLGETIAAYAIALLVAIILLVSFELNEGLGLRALVGHVVMLGTLAAFGSAAGRLLLAGGSDESKKDGS
jgi:putative integral membrane protein (TIGR02587 family)